MAKKKPEIPAHLEHHWALAIFVIAIIILLAIFFVPKPAKYDILVGPNNTVVIKEAIEAPAPKPEEKELPFADDESKYLKSSYPIYNEHNFGQFETKLQRVGFFKEQFRADIKVKNAGKETASFYEEGAVIKYNLQNYTYAGGNFSGADFSVGEERSGYILYKNVPKDINGEFTVIIGTSRAFSTLFGYVTSAPHTYKVELAK